MLHGYGTSEETRQRTKFLLEEGMRGYGEQQAVALIQVDPPTTVGFDPDDPMAEFDVGRIGVAISTLKDMEDIFKGIPLDKISTSFTVNGPASIILAMYVAAGEKQGVSSQILRRDGVTKDAIFRVLQEIRGPHRVTDQNPEEKYQALKRYSRDLTEEARKGKLDPVIGREEEIKRVMQILTRRTKNNPVLIGEPGVGKTAIVEGLAQRIVEGRRRRTGVPPRAQRRGEVHQQGGGVREGHQEDQGARDDGHRVSHVRV
jgi:hypothetical protein